MSDNTHEEKLQKESIFKVILLFVVQNLLISSFLYMYHVNSQKEDLFIAISEKSKTVGNSVVGIIQSSLQYGIPLNKVTGGEEFLNNKVKSAKELEYIIVTDKEGEIIAQSGANDKEKTKENYNEGIKGRLKSFAKMQSLLDENASAFKLYSYHNIPLRILVDNKLKGYVHVGISNRAVDSNIENIFYDIFIIVLASLIIGYEFLSYIFRNSVTQLMNDFSEGLKRIVDKDFTKTTTPRAIETFGKTLLTLNGNIDNLSNWYNKLMARLSKINKNNNKYDLIRDNLRDISLTYKFSNDSITKLQITPVVNNLRLVMFLVLFSEALIITSIPSYAAQFYETNFYVSKAMLSAIPIICNMLFVTIMIPFAPKLSYKVGFRLSFIIGAILMGVGYLLGACFSSLAGLLLSRSITGLGFATSYVCCQNYVAAYATDKTRIQSYTIFTIASSAGYICGTPIGCILVDNIGNRSIFFLSFLISALCLIISKKYIVDLKFVTLSKKRESTKTTWDLFKLKELSIPLIFSVLPTRFLFSAIICFLYPLYLVSLNNSQSVIGRIMMLFGLISFLLAPYASKFVQKIKNPNLIALATSSIMSIAMMSDKYYKTTEGVILQVIIHTICILIYIISMMTILEKISAKNFEDFPKSSIFSFYFIFERLGMIVGPGITSLLLSRTDYSHTLFYLGFVLLLANCVYGIHILYTYYTTKAKGAQ